jgi:SAM-dependent methyltransferase
VTPEPEQLPELRLLCPRTRAPLVAEGEYLQGNGIRYPIAGGVADFLEGAAGGAAPGVHTDYVIARRPYEGLARRTHGPIVQELEERYFELAERKLGRKLDILDIGCGSAKFLPARAGGPKPSLELFLRHARRYAGVDPSWAMLRAATAAESLFSRLPNATLVRAIAEALPFGDASFDLVFVKSTLDHCADADAALSEFRRVLRPEGSVLITLQNFGSWQRRAVGTLMRRRYREHRQRDHHTSPFDPELLRTRLRAAGFEIEELREMGYLHVSRYKLAWLENALLAAPHLIAKERGVIRCVNEVDRILSRVAPGLGATMICSARPAG